MKIEYLNEIWRDIKGYEGLYQVSNFGRVRSLDRIVNGNWKNPNIKRNGKILKINILPSGYCRVLLSKDGKTKLHYVHRLVATAFIPNPNNYPCVNHKDENKQNNCVENLEWCTQKYNNNYRNRQKKIAKKNTNGKMSKPVLQYDLQGNFIKEWPSIMEIERQLGFDQGYISNCCNGKYKTAYGYIWKFKDTE